jgi:hypothetical protein
MAIERQAIGRIDQRQGLAARSRCSLEQGLDG